MRPPVVIARSRWSPTRPFGLFPPRWEQALAAMVLPLDCARRLHTFHQAFLQGPRSMVSVRPHPSRVSVFSVPSASSATGDKKRLLFALSSLSPQGLGPTRSPFRSSFFFLQTLATPGIKIRAARLMSLTVPSGFLSPVRAPVELPLSALLEFYFVFPSVDSGKNLATAVEQICLRDPFLFFTASFRPIPLFFSSCEPSRPTFTPPPLWSMGSRSARGELLDRLVLLPHVRPVFLA